MPIPPRYAPNQVISLDGTSNLRDLGGWKTRQGSHTRFGKLFRSAKLSNLTATDEQQLARLGIRSICDLRGAKERGREASTHLSGTQLHHLAIESHLDQQLQDILGKREIAPADIDNFINTAYETYPQVCTEQLRTLFALIIDESNLPLLFHCAAGKDRTGFFAAVVLTTLGVEWDLVLQDYLATNQHWRRDYTIPKCLTEELGAPLFAANAGLLTLSFKSIEAHYGSFDVYVRDALGIDAATRLELQRLLTR